MFAFSGITVTALWVHFRFSEFRIIVCEVKNRLPILVILLVQQPPGSAEPVSTPLNGYCSSSSSSSSSSSGGGGGGGGGGSSSSSVVVVVVVVYLHDNSKGYHFEKPTE